MAVVDGPGRIDACIERGLSREHLKLASKISVNLS
jgi:hypothetical protein